jgi:antitoxin (DNA-binding transcriptional repressor) of toxin-antitoxin stability system
MVISKAILKARLLEYLRKMQETGEEIIITDHKRPVGRISLLHPPRRNFAELFAPYRGQAVYLEDPTGSTQAEWSDV